MTKREKTMINLKDLPFDFEVKEYDVRGNKDGSRAAANRDIGRTAMILQDDIEDAYVAQFFSFHYKIRNRFWIINIHFSYFNFTGIGVQHIYFHCFFPFFVTWIYYKYLNKSSTILIIYE